MSRKMVPPVRIGLTKKPATPAPASADQDPDDPDDISALMSESTMEVLEDIVQVHQEEIRGEDVELPDLDDELERDLDPDFVPPSPRPSTSSINKGKRLINKPQVQPKRSLNLLNRDTQDPETEGKGRSNAPIWKYFNVSDRKVANGLIEKGAVCIVEVGGVLCGKRIMQNGSSTTGLNHPVPTEHL